MLPKPQLETVKARIKLTTVTLYKEWDPHKAHMETIKGTMPRKTHWETIKAWLKSSNAS